MPQGAGKAHEPIHLREAQLVFLPDSLFSRTRREGLFFCGGGPVRRGACSRATLHARLRCGIGICGKSVSLGVAGGCFAWQAWGTGPCEATQGRAPISPEYESVPPGSVPDFSSVGVTGPFPVPQSGGGGEAPNQGAGVPADQMAFLQQIGTMVQVRVAGGRNFGSGRLAGHRGKRRGSCVACEVGGVCAPATIRLCACA